MLGKGKKKPKKNKRTKMDFFTTMKILINIVLSLAWLFLFIGIVKVLYYIALVLLIIGLILLSILVIWLGRKKQNLAAGLGLVSIACIVAALVVAFLVFEEQITDFNTNTFISFILTLVAIFFFDIIPNPNKTSNKN